MLHLDLTTLSNIRPTKKFEFDLDQTDSQLPRREDFLIPMRYNSDKPVIYLCGHSLGLQPVSAASEVQGVMDQWARMGVRGHFEGEAWIRYQDEMDAMMAQLVGARANEVTIMGTLTSNLHLLMTSFHRPSKSRSKVVMEAKAFPSDLYAVKSHLKSRGRDPEEILYWQRNSDSGHLELSDLNELMEQQGDQISVLLIGGINYYTGERLDMRALTALAHAHGILVGLDLAHAVGNVELQLHDWGVDFAMWCSYKYLNGGPGCPGAIFIHQRHHDTQLVRFEGWWGNDLSNRFEMLPDFTPAPGAQGWRLSNPPILGLSALKASLKLFQQIGMSRLANKSRFLTTFLLDQLDKMDQNVFQILTPRDPDRRGAMLSLKFARDGKSIFDLVTAAGIVADYRTPDVIRVAPMHWYNSFDDLYQFVQTLKKSIT